jgi:hypothetical protein
VLDGAEAGAGILPGTSLPMTWTPRLRPAWWKGTAMTPAARMNWSRAAPSAVPAPARSGSASGMVEAASAITVRRSAGRVGHGGDETAAAPGAGGDGDLRVESRRPVQPGMRDAV